MKVTGINGSARKDGNTAILIRRVFAELEKEGIETELIQLAGKKITGCIACGKCRENKDKRCSVNNDSFNKTFEKMLDADGIILGSPTYFADMTPEMKALIDRAGYVSRGNDELLKGKVGAAVSAVRRAGAIHTLDSINHLFLMSQMIIPGSSYWNIGIGREKGDVESDTEGMQTMQVLGQNMAWLLKKINS
ncbi:MAG TPA: flavodoxin family protein [Syntrophomonadaceae bacterium]|nr:flavodoxin family protein [Syntrophomonadaceae bacterium]HPR92795.1 flavodoxin family protein [Syntrophomonadaceae bacterium]